MLLFGTVGLVVGLILNSPTLMFVIGAGYVTYWALRSVDMGVRQVIELGNLRRYEDIDWSSRLDRLTDPYPRLHALAEQSRLTVDEAEELAALRHLGAQRVGRPGPDRAAPPGGDPGGQRGPGILRGTLDALTAADYPGERLLVCLSFEARSRRWTEERSRPWLRRTASGSGWC